MKKTLCVGILCLSLFARSAYAQTVSYRDERKEMLTQLLNLYTQLLNLLLAQQASLTSIQQSLLPSGGEPDTMVSALHTMQTISITVDNKRENENGVYYDVYAFYQENDKDMLGVPMTITTDDNGSFNSNGVSYVQSAEQISHTGLPNGRIGVSFQYMPEKTGDRHLTVTANGVSQTITSWGQR